MPASAASALDTRIEVTAFDFEKAGFFFFFGALPSSSLAPSAALCTASRVTESIAS